MSTDYYRFRKPFTSAEIEPGPAHSRLRLFVNHALAGEITVRNEEVAGVLMALACDQPAITTSGPLDFGSALADVEPTTCLISERGDLVHGSDIGVGPLP